MTLAPSRVILIESGMTNRTLSIDRYTTDVHGMLEAAGHTVERGPGAFFPALRPKNRALNKQLGAQVASSAPDFVHTTSTWQAYQLRRFPGPARVATCHDLYPMTIPNFFQPGIRGEFDRRMLAFARGGFRAADSIICVSSWTAGVLSEWAEIDPARMSVVHNIVDESFTPVANAEETLAAAGFALPAGPRMLTVGTAGWMKNLALAIRALAAPGMKGVQYVRVGGKLPPELEALARNIGVMDRITQLPFVPEALLPAVYSACDVLLQPSVAEGFGYPVAEAMACGTPVVCSDGGALPEVVGDAAIIVPLHSPPHLADEARSFAHEVEKVVSDPALAADMRARGLEQVKRFRRDAIAARLFDAYAQARDARARR